MFWIPINIQTFGFRLQENFTDNLISVFFFLCTKEGKSSLISTFMNPKNKRKVEKNVSKNI